MKNSATVITHGLETGHSAAAAVTVNFRELTQADIEYAMRKEDACRAARAAHQAKISGGKIPYIAPGPGGSTF